MDKIASKSYAYRDAFGNVIHVTYELKDGCKHGIEIIRKETDKGREVIEENTYGEGIKREKRLYEKGQLIEYIKYIQGVKEGVHQEYVNGKINIEKNYYEGFLDGKTTYFNNEIGKKEVFYKDGYIVKEIQIYLDEDSETLKVEKHYNNNLLEKEIITKVDLNLTSKSIKHFSIYKIHIEKQYEDGKLVKYYYHSDYNKSGKVFYYEEGKLISKQIYGSNFYLKEFPFFRAPFTYFKLYFTKKIKLYLSKNYEECFTCDKNGMFFNPLAENGISKCEKCNGYKIFNKKSTIDWIVKIYSKLPHEYKNRLHEKNQSTWSFITKY
jgi:antitoxin component YwqK of YwqJK toxin-antitoxin module